MALPTLKECLAEAQKRYGYKLHSLYHQKLHHNIELKLDDTQSLTNKLNHTCFNLHPRVHQRLFPEPQSLLSLTTEIYTSKRKWKFLDHAPNTCFTSKLNLSDITHFMSDHNSLKDPRLLFEKHQTKHYDNNLEQELRCLTHKYCIRMICCAHYIHPQLHKELHSININDIHNKQNIHSLYFQSFIQCLYYYHDRNYLMCLLFGTSFIEKLLGDSLMNGDDQKQSQLKDVPHNIIDLLMLQTMKQNVLNDDLHLILFCLMGPPFSCNIRNISWHGFFSNDDMIPKHLCSLLLYILQELLSVLNTGKANKLAECQRTFKTKLISGFSTWSNIETIPKMTSKYNTDAMQFMSDILKQSYFIPVYHHKDFVRIFQIYLDSDKNTDYYEIGSMLFCILEDAIRRVIVSVSNNKDDETSKLPTTRILAEDYVLFVSFIFLNHRDLFRMKISSALTRSQITKWTSSGFMSLLQDLIIANDGPRFRDTLAHFEVDKKHISPVLIHLLMNLCLYSIVRFSWYDMKHCKYKNTVTTFNDIYRFVDGYKPCYHPVSFCIMEWKKYQLICQQFQEYAAEYFSPDVTSIQCGNKMIKVSDVLQNSTALINKLKSIRNECDDTESKHNDSHQTPLAYEEYVGSALDSLNVDHKDEDLDHDLFDNMNQGICKNITKMLRIINPSITLLIDAHQTMKKEMKDNEDNDELIPTRKLKQFSKLTHGLSLWSCCINVIYESIQCAFCTDIKMPYKLWSKYLQCATKMQNKLRSKQYGEGLLELKQSMDHCQIWINKRK